VPWRDPPFRLGLDRGALLGSAIAEDPQKLRLPLPKDGTSWTYQARGRGTPVSQDERTSDSHRPQDFVARVGWLLGTALNVALAAFVVAGGAVLATYQRSMNHDA
jgi:hypothetical protein